MLNLKDQLEVQSGKLKPDAVNEKLIETTHASGINFARDFNTNYTQFSILDNSSLPINVKASAYLNKMLSATNKMITSDSTARESLKNVMASLIAKLNIATPEAITATTRVIWEGFVNDNIEKAIELFAQVRIDEKTEYQSPVNP